MINQLLFTDSEIFVSIIIYTDASPVSSLKLLCLVVLGRIKKFSVLDSTVTGTTYDSNCHPPKTLFTLTSKTTLNLVLKITVLRTIKNVLILNAVIYFQIYVHSLRL